MKKSIVLAFIIMCSVIVMNAQETLKINTEKSQIKWFGEMTFRFYGHHGFIKFKKGEFIKVNDKITGGSFVIDMNSITTTDMDNPKANNSLTEHLKNNDFFDVLSFPIARLIITNVNYVSSTDVKITANLTVKGITKVIRFNGKLNFEKLEMTAKFKIDRTRWGINYNSSVKDKAISDAIGFDVVLNL